MFSDLFTDLVWYHDIIRDFPRIQGLNTRMKDKDVINQ